MQSNGEGGIALQTLNGEESSTVSDVSEEEHELPEIEKKRASKSNDSSNEETQSSPSETERDYSSDDEEEKVTTPYHLIGACCFLTAIVVGIACAVVCFF